MKYLSIKIFCIVWLLIGAVGLVVPAAEIATSGFDTGALVRLAGNLIVIGGALLTLLMRRLGVFIFVTGMYLGVVANSLFPDAQQTQAIAEAGYPMVIGFAVGFVSIIVGIYLACTLPHWKNMR